MVDGQYYFFDPTFELNYKDGSAYVYYGMTLEERLESGAIEDLIWLGRYRDCEFAVAKNHLNVH